MIFVKLKSLYQALPPWWKLFFTLSTGLVCGLVVFLMHISNFFSYLSDSPDTCMNCHIMGPQYSSWYHSSHRERATCVDCHVPHDNIFHSYAFKAMDGMRHAAIFTLRAEPHAIQIRQAGIDAVQMNCKRCHSEVFRHGQTTMALNTWNEKEGKGRLCWDCHRLTPHGKVRSLASAPLARVPTTQSMVPPWLTQLMQKEKGK